MGGFHGGHSGGGGGFHGGHSGGSFHGGAHHSSVHVHVRTPYHHHGRIYYKPDYGTSNGKPMTYAGAMLMGIIFLIVAVLVGVLGIKTATNATVTKAWQVKDAWGATYEKYEFSYTFNGVSYSGHGDDECVYENGQYVLDIKAGDVYPVYVHFYNPSDYEFEDDNVVFITISAFVGIFGLIICVSSTKKYLKHKKDLAEIGDVNGDGKIDDDDMEYQEAKNKQQIEKLKTEKYCPYCGSTLDISAKFCPSCGSKQA